MISIFAELPESLHAVLSQYLDTHPECDRDQVLIAALALFLMQNGDRNSISAKRISEGNGVAAFANGNFDL